MTADRDARIDAMLDKHEIYEVLMRYCRGVDRTDADLIESTFHPDAVDEHGTVVERGAPAIAARIVESLRTNGSTTSMHLVGNVLIDLQGDVAFSESYFVSMQQLVRDERDYTRHRGGRYVDRLERRGGEWRIAHRVVADEWDRFDEVNERAPGFETFVRGLRGHDDVVYRMPKP
jgi:hypothetical protein